MTNKEQKQTEPYYAKNMQTIYYKYNRERKGRTNFYPSVLKSCGTTLANHIIDYTKKGGDINNLTPESLFKKN